MQSLSRAELELVQAIRQQGSLARAARALDLAAPVVTRRLAALEHRLGARLFQRSTRRLGVTPEGETVCRHAASLLAGYAALDAELRERQGEPSGPIRLASSLGFGRLWLGPALAAFQQRHPAVRIQLLLSEHLPDLEAGGLDGAVWLWSVRGAQAVDRVSRRLARNQRVLLATPGYLRAHGTPRTPDELSQHACLVVRENADAATSGFNVWALQRERDRASVRVRVDGPLTSNSGELVRDWCLQGHGIMLRSLWDTAALIAQRRLVRVLDAWSMPDADIHWVAPWQAQTPRRIRLLIDYLAEQFKSEPWKNARPVSPR